MLEPDVTVLRDLLLEADRDREGRAARGRAGREAAAGLSWDAVAASYRARMHVLLARPPRSSAPAVTPFPLEGGERGRLLATPAWEGDDRLGELLTAWAAETAPGDGLCLYLVGDRARHGDGGGLAERVMAAADASGADLDAGCDITIVVQPLAEGTEAALHAAASGFARLHGADAGGARLAVSAGNPVLEPTAAGIAAWRSSLLQGERAA
jgi:hypothetical protein